MNRRKATVIATGATFLLLVVGVTSGGFFSPQNSESSQPVAALAPATAAAVSSDSTSAPAIAQGETRSRPAKYDDDDDDEREHGDRKGREGARSERRNSGERDR